MFGILSVILNVNVKVAWQEETQQKDKESQKVVLGIIYYSLSFAYKFLNIKKKILFCSGDSKNGPNKKTDVIYITDIDDRLSAKYTSSRGEHLCSNGTKDSRWTVVNKCAWLPSCRNHKKQPGDSVYLILKRLLLSAHAHHLHVNVYG